MTLNILIVNRGSVSGTVTTPSRAVEERLLVPMSFLQNQGRINLCLETEAKCQNIDLGHFSHILFSRPFSNESLAVAQRAKKLGIQIINDLDDLPIYRPVSDPKSSFSQSQVILFWKLLRISDIVTCSTARIHHWAKENLKESKTQLLHTGFDFKKIDQATPSQQVFHDKTVLFTNTGALKLGNFAQHWVNSIKNILLELDWKMDVFADRIDYFPKDFPLRYLGTASWFKHKVLINRAYPLAIVPLAAYEDPEHMLFAQFKTASKYIGYGGLGIPAIYSKSPIYEEEVANNKTGLVVPNNADAWTAALRDAILSPEKRKYIAENAIKDVRGRYSVETVSSQWEDLFRDSYVGRA